MESEGVLGVQTSQSTRPPGDAGPEMTSEEKKTALVAITTFMAAIIALGTIGNVLVILAIIQTKKLQTVSNLFVANLSTCDLMFVTIVLPVNMYTYLCNGWHLPMILCKFVGFLCYTLTGTTIITITLIAWNRYKLVVDVSRYKQLFRPRNMAVMLAASWVIPVLCLQPAVLEKWGHFGYIPMLSSCNLGLDNSSQSFKIFLLIVRAAIPCGLIIYFYSSIYVTTRESHQRLYCISRSGSNVMKQLNHKREMRLTRMMIAIFVVFVLSYFPCTISSVIDWSKVLSKTIHMFCQTSIFLGSAVNPLLYGFMNEQFRKAYYRIITCKVMFRRGKQGPAATRETTYVDNNEGKPDATSDDPSVNTYQESPPNKSRLFLMPDDSISVSPATSPCLTDTRQDLLFVSDKGGLRNMPSKCQRSPGSDNTCQWQINADTEALCQLSPTQNMYGFQNNSV
ncbi:unnamed protein product [Candidula unifasciata]|uniref:G-protein coupled receptors family 1 profile domain-containing protein n=1 Tax=Candidula unifasciata TaxID=100452 RepID=A0A8S3YNT9_9EUPU|nr:unnamed protein product [Candidula unifasciata]